MSKVRSLVIATTLTVVASFVGGCVVHGRTHVRAGVAVEGPSNLVEVSPGVWVVEDYHEPVFYSDNYYWAYRSGIWYRSSYYDYGFARVSVVPARVRTIRRPRAYVRYRSTNRARVRTINNRHRYHSPRRSNVRDHRSRDRYQPTRTNTRDNRSYRGSPANRGYRGNSRANTRDHRARPAPRGRDYRGNSRANTRDNRTRKPAPKKKSKSRDRRRNY
jgi:hypothetical protein